MSKVKVKKQSTFIDMTAMSDVTVLLLTFFMLTANFIPKEPVQVQTPSSVSEIKVPDFDVLTVLIDPQGRVFLNLDKPEDKKQILEKVGEFYNIKFTPQQVLSFQNQVSIGMPIQTMQSFLDKRMEDQDKMLKDYGIPTDTILGPKNELAQWIRYSKSVNENLAIAIKADQGTPYPMVKKVLSTLQDLKENRYSLVTSLRGMPSDERL